MTGIIPFDSFTDFIDGGGYVMKGIKTFFHDRGLLKYAVLPLMIVLALYAGACCLSWKVGFYLYEVCRKWCAALPDLLQVMLGGILLFLTLLALLILMLSTISIVYELLGGYFFDSMICIFEKKNYDFVPPPHSVGFEIQFVLKSLYWESGTMLRLLGLLILGIFFPILGQILLVLIVGHRMGISYLSSTASSHHLDILKMKKLTDNRKSLILGFGTTCYLILLIPFSALVVLPGICIGANLLFHQKIMEVK